MVDYDESPKMRRKQDLNKDEICLENERWLSRIKPRFRTGEKPNVGYLEKAV